MPINRENMTTHIGVLPLQLCQFLSLLLSNHEIDHLDSPTQKSEPTRSTRLDDYIIPAVASSQNRSVSLPLFLKKHAICLENYFDFGNECSNTGAVSSLPP